MAAQQTHVHAGFMEIHKDLGLFMSSPIYSDNQTIIVTVTVPNNGRPIPARGWGTPVVAPSSGSLW